MSQKMKFVAAAVLPSLLALACAAQSNERVDSWWPDTAQGLMWSGSAVGGPSSTQNFQKAEQSCRNLSVQGFTGWRLPTITELDHVVDSETYDMVSIHRDGAHLDNQVGGTGISFTSLYGAWIWSSTPGSKGNILAERHGLEGHAQSSPTTSWKHQVLCVRPLEPEIAALAKQAKPQYSVPSLVYLRALVPLHDSYVAYSAGNYTKGLASAQAALVISPQLPEAIYARGLNEAAMKNWQEALNDFQTVKKLKWGSMSYAISWAKNNAKAAATGTPVNPKKNDTPSWNFNH
jgi:tetratricopeptide (TPR) repeat protein